MGSLKKNSNRAASDEEVIYNETCGNNGATTNVIEDESKIEININGEAPNIRFISFLQCNSNNNKGNICGNVNTTFCHLVEPYTHQLSRLFFIKLY